MTLVCMESMTTISRMTGIYIPSDEDKASLSTHRFLSQHLSWKHPWPEYVHAFITLPRIRQDYISIIKKYIEKLEDVIAMIGKCLHKQVLKDQKVDTLNSTHRAKLALDIWVG